MNRNQYENKRDYKKARKILNGFVDEELDGDIDAMRTFWFDNLTKFIGNIGDPDMYLIVQAIYIILWGDIYDLTFEKMGAWDLKGTYAFRGDTINSFGSLFGKESKENEFGYRAKFFGADKDIILWNKIKEFSRLYHQIGNFIVIPNRSSVQYGINGARGCYYNTDYCEGMKREKIMAPTIVIGGSPDERETCLFRLWQSLGCTKAVLLCSQRDVWRNKQL